jgi:Domain of unknown function (DUF4292)
MRQHIFYIILILFSVFAACKSKKPADTSGVPTVIEVGMAPETAAMLDKVMATQLPYTWFAGSGQGKIDWDGQRLSARFNVRILHDSIIWVQVQKFGFEVGRMLVTPDSAFFINRFERTYSVYRTKDFLREYNVPADFEMFSKVFTAGAYLPPTIKKSMVEGDGSVYFQSGNGMSARHWFDASSLLVRSLITDPFKREWSSEYSDYKRTNSGQRFPYTRLNTLVIDGRPNIFDLEYSEMVIDVPQQFPFSIPSHYEKI